jgi:hypothetical protein
MATCPEGHESTATDFCDLCGRRIDGAAAVSGQASQSAPAAEAPGATATLTEPAAGQTTAPPAQGKDTCPNCSAERTGQFCESCGFNFSSGAVAAAPPVGAPAVPAPAVPAQAVSEPTGPVAANPPAATTTPAWNATITANRDYFDSVVAAGGPEAGTIQFPAYCPERQFRLAGPEMRIGRRSASRGLEPEIDLTGPPMDTGVSHLHAVLIQEPDGNWSVLDPGSSNGTQLNGTEIATGVKMPLHDGDAITLGGWTLITIRAS